MNSSKIKFTALLLLAACAVHETKPQGETSAGQSHTAERVIASSEPTAKARRSIKNQKFENVGAILKDGKPFCSGAIVKHGVFLTAKHCFSGRQFDRDGLKNFSIAFLTANSAPENPVIVGPENVVRVFPDDGFNDLAYILYFPEATQGKVKLEVPLYDAANFEDEFSSLVLVGFPVTSSPTPQKVFSESCALGEMTGRYRKFPKSLHYQGDLYETSCPAFEANSGGPAVGIKVITSESGLSAKLSIVGVVTHTFHDEHAIQKDSLGSYVDDANISPVRDARNLKQMLALDIHSLSGANFLGDKRSMLRTPSLRVSDWVSSRKNLAEKFYATKTFWKKERDASAIARKRQEYAAQFGDAVSKCPAEANRLQGVFNNIIAKNNLSSYLQDENALKVILDCSDTGLSGGTWFGSILVGRGMVNALKSVGALACFVGHETSHHLLRHDLIERHEITLARKELDADSLGIALAVQAGYKKSDCLEFLNLTKILDPKLPGSEDPYPSSYERLQNLKDLTIDK